MIAHHHPEVRNAEFVAFANEERRYTDFTDAVCRLLGYSRDELLNKTVEDVSFKMANVREIFAEFVRKGAMHGDYVLRHKDGSAIPIHFSAYAFADGCHAAVWTPIKDWREPYLSALIETDPAKLARKVEIAMSAIDRARTDESGASAGSDEQALRDAQSALKVLSRSAAR
ncbi:MAG TPA: PAS domain-containing protein [Candidatus Acidoferrum sp.]|jgi:PAS domain S-box-containing protein